MIPVDARQQMVELHPKISFAKQCNLLTINRNFLYYNPVPESVENLELMRILDEKYLETPFYGYRKLTVYLQSKGYAINEKRVRRLMKLINWQTIYRVPKTTVSNPEHEKFPYLLRSLEIVRRNQVWATDITYVPMDKGFMYLAAIIDLHTRYVLHWEVSNSMDANWCVKLLQDTLQKHGKPEIFNTDQGSQYTSLAHISVLKDNEIKISMDGKGRAIDNIFIERLWRSVKYENIYLQCYEDGKSLYRGLQRYFEFYNHDRFHQSLKYATPASMYENAKTLVE